MCLALEEETQSSLLYSGTLLGGKVNPTESSDSGSRQRPEAARSQQTRGPVEKEVCGTLPAWQ